VRLTLLIHILAGALGLAFGYVALYSTKGATLHRRSGMLFVYAMVTMCLGGFALAGGGRRNGVPAFPFFLFGVVGLVASGGDLRMIRSGALRGASRLTRHLWRMSFALFIAAMSFFFGQAKVIPEPLRIMPLLAVPVLAVLVTMVYWLWRVQHKRASRALVGVSAQEAM
jgi:uncharacterized membrane protein